MEINKETSYLIGLYQSDGTLYQQTRNRGRASIEISKKDINILLKIKELLDCNYTIKQRNRNIKIKNKMYEHQSVSINVYDKKYRDFLELNGVPYGKKSKIIDVPETEKLSKIDYIRGLFDGDGSLGFTKKGFPYIGFVSESEKIKDYFLQFFSDITNNIKKENNRNKRDNLYNIVMFKEDAVKFCKIVYYDDCLSINRKYDIARNIINWIRPAEMKKINFERKKWTQEDDNFILTNSLTESIEKLKRTKKSIIMRKIRLKNNFLY